MTAQRVFNAPTPVSNEVPAYRVFEYDGPPIEKTVARFDEKSRTIIKETIYLEGGYMVVFAKGHRTYYENLAALEKAGHCEVVTLIRLGDSNEAEIGKDVPIKATQRVIEKAK